MNFAKRTLMVVSVMALAVLIVAVLAPNTAHGLVAALVQVTNTSTNPVPNQDVDNPARHPVLLTAQLTATQQISTVPLAITAPSSPGSRTMVMEYFSATCNAPLQSANSAENYIAEISLQSPVLADDGSFSGNYSQITTFLPQQASAFRSSKPLSLLNSTPRLRPASWSSARSAAQSSGTNTPMGTDYVVSQPVKLYIHPVVPTGDVTVPGIYASVVLNINDTTLNGRPTCQFSAQGYTVSSQ